MSFNFLWGNTFHGNPNEEAFYFNESLSFDSALAPFDIRGSIEHVKMLKDVNIISKEECEKIQITLKEIEKDLQEGKLKTTDSKEEDIHSFIENELTRRIGNVGKKLHTARSRNDQVAIDTRLWTAYNVKNIISGLLELSKTLIDLEKKHKKTIMPGTTHLQAAQPITFGFYISAFNEMFLRDAGRFTDSLKRTKISPLGSCALAGTGHPIDRKTTAKAFGDWIVCNNASDGVSDRDFIAESIFCLSMTQMHLSRLAEEMILFSSTNYRYITISDEYSTGSSIMPQKKNPDIAELIRGKTGRVYGSLINILTSLKALPMAYNKDLQEDKPPLFDSFKTVLLCLKMMKQMMGTISVNKDRMLEAAQNGFMNATDIADYLVGKGTPFRDAYSQAALLVGIAQKKNCSLEKLPLSDFLTVNKNFGKDINSYISLESCVERRTSYGGTASGEVERQIKEQENIIANLSKTKGDKYGY